MTDFQAICPKGLYMLLACCMLAAACHSPAAREENHLAQQVIDQAIAVHGGSRYEDADIRFRFRDKTYRALLQNGRFQYERSFPLPEDSLQLVHDVLTNEGFFREINGIRQALPDSTADKYANALNSVIYFALLPYRLNDPAVNKTYLGEVRIKGEPYHKIAIDFDQQGGGKDYEDTFVYWIHQQQYTMDYLAYRFHVEGGGIRFRAAYNPRLVGGIRFADYENYQMDPTYPLHLADSLYEAGALKRLSLIELKDIQLSPPSE